MPNLEDTKGRDMLKHAFKKPFSWLSKSTGSQEPKSAKSADQTNANERPSISNQGMASSQSAAPPPVHRAFDDQEIPPPSWQLIDRLVRGGVYLEIENINSRERARVRGLVAEKIDSGMSGTEIGRFIVAQFRQNDQGLGHIITQMADRQFSYTDIALATMEILGLIDLREDLPGLPRQPILGGERRYYAREVAQQNQQVPSTAAHDLTICQRRGGSRPHLPLRTNHARLATGEGKRNMTAASIRSVQPSTYDEDPPLLRPATLERIRRGHP
ncbi:uncharacterized protein CIMG_12238 [Coccidioides immitis RS]|uniref:Uncharacterized protein n=3 Tax=Coccidioides immitis TaxID=5501 RepID=A0A0D8JTW1_COCIM|nr:uncharacterized protein CIMG_12238 [Coccidioides immitis RS]KJF60717.1 hypothetical protein CIMG_12238 [Coccidioides immitis RS]